MVSLTLLAGLVLGLSQIPSSIAQPANTGHVQVTHAASELFPNAKGGLSQFDVDVDYVGYDSKTRTWLSNLNPASGTSDEDKAKLLTAATFSKPFNVHNPDMANYVHALLAAVTGNTTAHPNHKRQEAYFQVNTDNAVNWPICSPVFQCDSGASCPFDVPVSGSPRARCTASGGQDCCTSWSTTSAQSGFFSRAWQGCDDSIRNQGPSLASCKAFGGQADGGNVCFSNRAKHCS